MPAVRNANASPPLSPARYRWDCGTDRIDWNGLDDNWRAVLADGQPDTGADLQNRLLEADQRERARALAQMRGTDAPVFVRYRLTSPEGPMWVQERLEIAEQANVLEGEITALTHGEAEVADLEGSASYDPLTGTFTRQRLYQGLQLAIAKTMGGNGGGTFLVVDIDNFGLLNHALGCRAGDAVLVKLAERLRVTVGNGSLLGRVGGDSFGIVLEGVTEDTALALAELVVRSVSDKPICGDEDIAVTVSVGAVVFPMSASSAEEAMARADLAVAGAKASGRNHFELYALSADQRAVQRRDLAIARRVQDALLEQRLIFAYQPIVRADRHQPAFYECLLRMRTPNNTLVPAGQFVPVVEELGLMRQIDHVVLDKAIHELSRDPSVTLAINVSGHTTSDRSWVKRLEGLSKAHGNASQRLIVEITETTAMRSLGDAIGFVDAVRGTGARVALDDFGAGYSSFRHLKSLRVDMVKIDGLFTGKLVEHPDNLLFFRALLGLAKGCGFETVAECAETAQDAVLLATAGVTYIQGYYFAKPELTRLKGSPTLPLGHEAGAGRPDTVGGLRFVS